MNTTKLFLPALLALAFMLTSINAHAQTATTSVFATGLKAPTKIITTPKGNLMVTEAGMGPNTGRISLLDFSGNRRTLIDGLPSGFAPPEGAPSGPSGIAMRGRTLFVVIGAGNGTVAGPTQGSELPNPNPSSPFLSSVLSLRLSPQAEETTQGFTMTFADQIALQDQGFLKLTDAIGNQLTVEVVANFPNFTADFPFTVRAANPFGIALKGNLLYVVDASQNVIYELNSEAPGSYRTLIRFLTKPNPLPFGPPVLDAVPNSIRLVGKSLLVSFLTGAPFPAGFAEVRKVRLANAASEPFIAGLTSAIDVLPPSDANGQGVFYTLEFSANMLVANTPGRLSGFNPADGSLTVLLNNLVTPTSLARNDANGELFVTEIFTGRIIRVQNL